MQSSAQGSPDEGVWHGSLTVVGIFRSTAWLWRRKESNTPEKRGLDACMWMISKGEVVMLVGGNVWRTWEMGRWGCMEGVGWDI